MKVDHQPLFGIFQSVDHVSRIARWVALLSEYSLAWEYRASKNHNNADGLNQCGVKEEDTLVLGGMDDKFDNVVMRYTTVETWRSLPNKYH